MAPRRLASGPMLGVVSVGAVFVFFAAYGLARGDLTWYLLFPAPVVGAGSMNAASWLAAIVSGRTRQLRPTWLLLVALLLLLGLAPTFSSGRDLEIPAAVALIALGFPTSILAALVFGRILPTPEGILVSVAVGT